MNGTHFSNFITQDDIKNNLQIIQYNSKNGISISIGDIVRYNGNSNIMMVLDIDDATVLLYDPWTKTEITGPINQVEKALKVDRVLDKLLIDWIGYEKYVDTISPVALYRSYIKINNKRRKK